MKKSRMLQHPKLVLLSAIIAFVALLALAMVPVASAQTTVAIDWDTLPDGSVPPTGLIITDQYGPASGFPAPFIVSAAGGANGDAVLFNTENPTGGDFDLGTPNDICDDGIDNDSAPGVGVGGNTTNCEARGFLLIVEENSTDGDGDRIIDSGAPDDAVGVVVTMTFDTPVFVVDANLIDQEANEPVEITAFDEDGNVIGTPVAAQGLGNNSYENVILNFPAVKTLVFDFGGSGGIESMVVETPEILAISMSDFSAASSAPAIGLWIALGAALLTTGFVLLRRRDLARLIR